jgi:hypothetical protein
MATSGLCKCSTTTENICTLDRLSERSGE